MSRFHSYLSAAEKIIQQYNGEITFAAHIKLYFSRQKKMGAADRRLVTSLCYGYFRVQAAFAGDTIRNIIIAGQFLQQIQPSLFLQFFAPEWNQLAHQSTVEKCSILKITREQLFPFVSELSPAITTQLYCTSLLIQPDLFLRTRPGKKKKVIEQLSIHNIPFTEEEGGELRLNPSVKLDALLQINADAVVQDKNSQHTLDALLPLLTKGNETVWDCCAASGGKSILLYDLAHKKIRLTVSDCRENIIRNLRDRFHQAGINAQRIMVADATSFITATKFDVIICDAPCSGSGTWSRTPEQIKFFSADKLKYYTNLQQRIIEQTVQSLQPGGIYVYITCSVFSEENESNTDFIVSLGLTLLHQTYLEGYRHKADTLYTAIFRSSLS